jgi:hypothetical protein
MADVVTVIPRARAWILVQSDAPRDEAQKLYDNLVDEGDDSYVVIRADVVDYEYNIVIVVDAENMGALHHVQRRILDFVPARRTAVLPVVQHIPVVPHDAQGFITDEELAAGADKTLTAGRQHSSPGANAWG